MKNIVIYTRVRNNDQAVVDSETKKQLALCSKYCEIKKYNIVASFIETYSGQTLKGPEWKKIIELVKNGGDNISKIVFTDWDRFSRNRAETMQAIIALKKINVELECIEQPIMFENLEETNILLSIYFPAILKNILN